MRGKSQDKITVSNCSYIDWRSAIAVDADGMQLGNSGRAARLARQLFNHLVKRVLLVVVQHAGELPCGIFG